MDGAPALHDATEQLCIVCGDEINAAALQHPLALSLLEFIEGFGGRDAQVTRIQRTTDGTETIILSVATGAPQKPAFDIMPKEALAVLFFDKGHPGVVPLRADFPMTPHSYGLPVEVPTSAAMSICIDDRPWEDAQADYNGAELFRRIAAWFARAGSGEMNEALQAADPVFLPPQRTIMMAHELGVRLSKETGPPVFLSIRELHEGGKLLLAEEYDLTSVQPNEGKEWVPFVGMTIFVGAENRTAMWRPPTHLGHLRESLGEGPIDLLEELKSRIATLLKEAGSETDRVHRSKLFIRLFLKNLLADRVEAICLITKSTIGEIGVALGLLFAPDEVADTSYALRIVSGSICEEDIEAIPLMPTNLSFAFDRARATELSGKGDDWTGKIGNSAVLLGAGSIGGHIVTNMVREGAFKKVVIVDDDHLSPHNLVRHVLRAPALGKPKAESLAEDLKEIRADLTVNVVLEKFGHGQSDLSLAAMREADLVLDVTASVGASREISDVKERGRAASAFFNPKGDAVVVLVEDETRIFDLAQLETRYYEKLVTETSLDRHLQSPDVAVVSGGQCRSETNRIPASSASILSGIASRNLGGALSDNAASITIASIRDDGLADVVHERPSGCVQTAMLDGWTVRIASEVADKLRALRRSAAPNETGGVIIGTVDHARHQIEVAFGLPAPSDSLSSKVAFERGVLGLRAEIERVRSQTMYQLCYLGEWHTHPDGTGVEPSQTDMEQLAQLREKIIMEKRPGLMLIVGERQLNVTAKADQR